MLASMSKSCYCARLLGQTSHIKMGRVGETPRGLTHYRRPSSLPHDNRRVAQAAVPAAQVRPGGPVVPRPPEGEAPVGRPLVPRDVGLPLLRPVPVRADALPVVGGLLVDHIEALDFVVFRGVL